MDALETSHPSSVADFACGDGRLLAAAQERFRRATMVGVDRDRRAIRRLRETHPRWILSVGDFLDAKSFSRSRASRISADVAVLNPPYSCRGQRTLEVALDGQVFRTSPASAFVARTLAEAPNVELVAILPEGALTSEKDLMIREHFEDSYGLTVISRFARSQFEDCAVRAVVVRLRRGSTRRVSRELESQHCVAAAVGHVDVGRGGLPMHEVRLAPRGPRVPLLHTTSLRSLPCTLPGVAPYSRGLVTGPCVVLPRVGVPDASQLKTLGRGDRVQLSDCILTFATSSVASAVALRNLLLAEIQSLRRSYVGTGARFLTVGRATRWLRSHGVCADSK
jgi:predicted RNA methylase